jgi:hypothetical protein
VALKDVPRKNARSSGGRFVGAALVAREKARSSGLAVAAVAPADVARGNARSSGLIERVCCALLELLVSNAAEMP